VVVVELELVVARVLKKNTTSVKLPIP